MVWRVSHVVQHRASYLSIGKSGKTGHEKKATRRGRACWVMGHDRQGEGVKETGTRRKYGYKVEDIWYSFIYHISISYSIPDS
jgi:hypothetical protein